MPVILKTPYSTSLETARFLRLAPIIVSGRKEKKLFDSVTINIMKEKMTAENLIVGFPNGLCYFAKGKKRKTCMCGKPLYFTTTGQSICGKIPT